MRLSNLIPLAGGALILAVAFTWTAVPGLSRATAAATSSCSTSGLVIWLNTQADHAAGSAYYKLEFTNLSGRACTLRGYPGVSAVDLAGHRLGSAAARDRAQSPRLVKLAAGATATATLQIVDVHNFPRSACHVVNAAGLRVFPPNETSSSVLPYPFAACSRRGPVYLRIRVVR